MLFKTIMFNLVGVAVFCGTVARAGDLVNIPSTFSETATFESTGKNTYVTSADGATVVINSASLIIGVAESRFSLCRADTCPAGSIALEAGTFRVHVGSQETIFTLGNVNLTVKEAALDISVSDDGWLVKVRIFFSGGSAVLASQQKSDSSTTTEKPPITAESLKREVLINLDIKGNTLPVSSTERERFESLAKRLDEPSATGPILTRVDVEHETDLVASMVDRTDAFEDVEIEEIEVEAGCVEVCLD